MGNKIFAPHLWREDEPYSFDPYQYDPQFGFNGERKEKVRTATVEEMDSANMELSVRDFCAHMRMRYRGCLAYNKPIVYKCKGLYRELRDCYTSEHIDDRKEFEREKRLNARERRLRQSA